LGRGLPVHSPTSKTGEEEEEEEEAGEAVCKTSDQSLASFNKQRDL
jgi:hypothetical protein